MFATNTKTPGSGNQVAADALEVADGDLDAVSTCGGRAAPTPSVDQKATSNTAGGHAVFTCNYYPPGN